MCIKNYAQSDEHFNDEKLFLFHSADTVIKVFEDLIYFKVVTLSQVKVNLQWKQQEIV